jgi:formate hydrogenlyase subunit 5
MCPPLSWYEREMTDLFGVQFAEQPEPFRLVLHEGARPAAPPMLPSYPSDVEMPFEVAHGDVTEVANPDIQRLPFGPVGADVLESAEMIFFYIGEHILHFQPKLFFKHR